MFITRSDQPVSDVQVDPPLLISDHSFVIAKFIVPFQPASARRPRVQRRCWKRFDVDVFTTDLLASDLVVSPPADVTEMFDCYNNTLRQLVNQHVPVITVTNYSRSTVPCLTETATSRKQKQDGSKKFTDEKAHVHLNGTGVNNIRNSDTFIHPSSLVIGPIRLTLVVITINPYGHVCVVCCIHRTVRVFSTRLMILLIILSTKWIKFVRQLQIPLYL